jgi:hypothetical protein
MIPVQLQPITISYLPYPLRRVLNEATPIDKEEVIQQVWRAISRWLYSQGDVFHQGE